MYNARDMYYMASAMALKKGPIIVPVNGKMTAVYALNRKEIENLFEENHFALRRSTWRNHLEDWDRYGALVPKEAFKKEILSNWYVIFTTIGKDDLTALHMFAEKNDVWYLPEFSGGMVA